MSEKPKRHKAATTRIRRALAPEGTDKSVPQIPVKSGTDSAIFKLSKEESIWHAVYQISPVSDGSSFAALKGLTSADAAPLEEMVRRHMNGLFDREERFEIIEDEKNPKFTGYLKARAGKEEQKGDRLFFTLAYNENYRLVLNDETLPQPSGRTAYFVGVPESIGTQLRSGLAEYLSKDLNRFIELYSAIFPTYAKRTGKITIDSSDRGKKIYTIPKVSQMPHAKHGDSWSGWSPDGVASDIKPGPGTARRYASMSIADVVAELSDTNKYTHAIRTWAEFVGDGHHSATLMTRGPKGEFVTKEIIAEEHPALATELGNRADLHFGYVYDKFTPELRKAREFAGSPFISTLSADHPNTIFLGYVANDMRGDTRNYELSDWHYTLYLIPLDKRAIPQDKLASIIRAAATNPAEVILPVFSKVFSEREIIPPGGWKIDPDHTAPRLLSPISSTDAYDRGTYTLEEFLEIHTPEHAKRIDLAAMSPQELAVFLATSKHTADALLGRFPQRFRDHQNLSYDIPDGARIMRSYNADLQTEQLFKEFMTGYKSPFTDNERTSGKPAYRARVATHKNDDGQLISVSYLDPKNPSANKEITWLFLLRNAIATQALPLLRENREIVLDMIQSGYPWAYRGTSALTLDDKFPRQFEDCEFHHGNGKRSTGRVSRITSIDQAVPAETPDGPTDIYYEYPEMEPTKVTNALQEWAQQLKAPHPSDPTRPAVIDSTNLVPKLEKAVAALSPKKVNLYGIEGNRFYVLPEDIAAVDAVIAGEARIHQLFEMKGKELLDLYRKFRDNAMAAFQDASNATARGVGYASPPELTLRQRYDRAVFEYLKVQDQNLKMGPRLDSIIAEREQFRKERDDSRRTVEYAKTLYNQLLTEVRASRGGQK